jgi:hypothetical protein
MTVFVIVSGPFGSYQTISLPLRLVIGLPIMSAMMLMGAILRVLVFRSLVLKGFRVAALTTASVASAVITPMIFSIIKLLPVNDRGQGPGFAEFMLLVFSLSLAHSTLIKLLERSQELVEDAAVEPERASLPVGDRILHRIDPGQRGPILSMSVRDHYVDVQTDKGQISLLLRFSDAMAEVDPQAGVQVHRSHWVAWQAIESIERDGSKLHLRLKVGTRVPVSKNHREKLRARGLI